MHTLYGGVEAGGTKFVCAIGSGAGEVLQRCEIPTTDPAETIQQVVQFFQSVPRIRALGVGSFGPVNVRVGTDSYGLIGQTPKPGWQGVNIRTELEKRLGLPVSLQTDVDVAALGERYHGKALQSDSFIYMTIGTGIGGSIFVNGQLLHGLSHSEMGHMQLPQTHKSPSIKNTCTLHENCLEGFASGRSMELIYGTKAQNLVDEVAWDREATFIGLGLANILMVLPVEMVILGGSIMKHEGMIERVRTKLLEAINGYIELPQFERYIVHASSDSIGVLGAIKLAQLAMVTV